MVLPFVSPLHYIWDCGSGRGEEPSGGNVLRLIRIRLTTSSLEKISPACQANYRNPELPIRVRQTRPAFPNRCSLFDSIFRSSLPKLSRELISRPRLLTDCRLIASRSDLLSK